MTNENPNHRDDFSELDALDAAFEKRREAILNVELEKELSPLRANEEKAKAEAAATLLDAKGRSAKMRGLAVLAAGAGIALMLFAAGYFVASNKELRTIIKDHTDKYFPWSKLDETAGTDVPRHETNESQAHKSEQSAAPSKLDAEVTQSDRVKRGDTQTDRPRQREQQAPPESTNETVPPGNMVGIPENPHIPEPQPEPTQAPEQQSRPEPQITVMRDPPKPASRHAPGSLAAQLEEEINNTQKPYSQREFTQSEEYQTAEYRGKIKTIENGSLIFNDGKVFNPINKDYIRTTNEYDGDFAYCRQSQPTENSYYCRVLHNGLEEKL